jgi:aspartate/methionine/tyrosine aminotransferase
MTLAPLDRVAELLPPAVQRVVTRETPIPTIALRAAQLRQQFPSLVRADIGQISGLDPALEVYYGPPVGLDELRAVVAETWNRVFRLTHGALPDLPQGLTPKHVAVCTGAAEALSLLFRCFAHGQKVGIPRGYWENYLNGVELGGGTPVIVDFFDAHGRLDIDGLRAQLAAHSIRLLVANFPNNPTGATLDESEMQALGALLQETDCLAIADEVYSRLRYDGKAPVSLLRFAPKHTVVIGSASKEYLIPGGRVGYMLSTNADLTDRVLRRLIRANTASPSVLGQRQLLALMQGDLDDLRHDRAPQLLHKIREEMGARLSRLLALLSKHGLPTVGRPGHAPAGTIFLMAGLPAWWAGDEASFAERLLEEGCVSVVPGAAFGLAGCVRISFGGLTLDQLDQLDHNLAAFRARHEAR